MDSQKVLTALKDTASSPVGKIALIAGGVFVVYKALSGRSSAGTSSVVPVNPGGLGISPVGGAGSSGSSGSSGPTIDEQIRLYETQAKIQSQAAEAARLSARQDREAAALFDLDLAGKQLEKAAKQQLENFNFWFSDVAGNFSNTLNSTNPGVSQRGRTPAVSSPRNPTRFDIAYEAQNRATVDQYNRDNARQYAAYQQQRQLQTEQNQFLQQQQDALIRQQERRDNPFSSWGNFFRTSAGVVSSIFSPGAGGGRPSAPVPVVNSAPAPIIVPYNPNPAGTASPLYNATLPGRSDLTSGVTLVA